MPILKLAKPNLVGLKQNFRNIHWPCKMISLASTVPIGVVNFFLVISGLVTVAWALWYYLDISFDRIKTLIVVATGGLLGTIYGFLPTEAKKWSEEVFESLFNSSWATIIVGAFAFSIWLLGFLLRRTAIDWKRGKPSIIVDGKHANIKTDDRAYNVWWFFYHRPALTIGDSTRTIQDKPFVLERIKLTEGEIYSGTPAYLEIANLLRLAFFQYVENRFLSQAKQEFATDTAKAFVGLNLVYNVLRLCFVENDISRTGDLIVERYEAEYPSSAWIPLLRAAAFYGRQDYVSATSVLKKRLCHTVLFGAPLMLFFTA
jgi:hypothetical protein